MKIQNKKSNFLVVNKEQILQTLRFYHFGAGDCWRQPTGF